MPFQKVIWTPVMIAKLVMEFPTRYNAELAAEIGVTLSTLRNKAKKHDLKKSTDLRKINNSSWSLEWTPEMEQQVKDEYAIRFTQDIADELNVSYQSVRRKAAEFGIEKDEDLREKNAKRWSEKMLLERGPSRHKGKKGEIMENSIKFKSGDQHISKTNPKILEKAAQTRNATIENERFRIRHGLFQKTKLKLDPYKDSKSKYK